MCILCALLWIFLAFGAYIKTTVIIVWYVDSQNEYCIVRVGQLGKYIQNHGFS